MVREEFISSDAWKIAKDRFEQTYDRHIRNAAHGSAADHEYNRGWADALQFAINLPDVLYPRPNKERP